MITLLKPVLLAIVLVICTIIRIIDFTSSMTIKHVDFTLHMTKNVYTSFPPLQMSVRH